MSQKTPIALIIFSNDLDNYLPNIETERKIIEEALEHYYDTNRLKVITRSSVSLAELFRLFNKYSNRIVLFHFAGHAEGNGLQFNQNIVNTQTGKAEGIADLMKREVENGILKFVFLNGCSTVGQVDQLKTVGVPSIMATHYPINDNEAVNFAAMFYKTWAKSDNLANAFETPFTTIQTAFETALAYLKSRHTVSIEETTRGFVFEIAETKTTIPWELFTTNAEQTLDFDIAKESKTFNEFLTRRLIEALVPYSRSASKFLPLANKKAIDWETILTISNKAKEVIVYSFIGVLGIQLQKLFAIGKEDLSTTKQRKYIETCLFTTKRTLKLLNFALLSTLWDFRMSRKNTKNFQLDTKQQQILSNFFDDDFELDIQGYFDLLKAIYNIYTKNNLEFPFAEL
ncbi:MAG: CHAT domain-containing protein [Saprospiraceae bacterium]